MYGSEVAFFHLDVDMPAGDSARSTYSITGRSQYILLGPDGAEAQRWFGPLSFEAVSAEIDALLDSTP